MSLVCLGLPVDVAPYINIPVDDDFPSCEFKVSVGDVLEKPVRGRVVNKTEASCDVSFRFEDSVLAADNIALYEQVVVDDFFLHLISNLGAGHISPVELLLLVLLLLGRCLFPKHHDAREVGESKD